ncbi:6999_t:CDS:1 [Ambispora gerdemannii]|uniref:6999_t:CDS:1 n=1 Tax=Ambispora gerdemannii TaxID=144530 RepID=A0A9N9FMH7_9GLOM|nr:6999_t:CDS:1 [Ambispora gerdemannii]
MGLPAANHKRVVIPTYKITDQVPEYYHDPHSGEFIPTRYFLDNLDNIGPQHWKNLYSADLSLHVVGTTYNGNYSHNNNVGFRQMMNHLGLINDAMVSESGFGSEGSDYGDYSDDSDTMMSEEESVIDEYPVHQYHNNNNLHQHNVYNKSATTGSLRYQTYFSHTLILATQSGFFNQLLGPINNTNSLSSLNNDNDVMITVPHPEVFEPILHWLYHHDDESWLDEMSLENFQQIYENVKYLKLGKEAYDVLDQFISEVEETGIEIEIDGVVE